VEEEKLAQEVGEAEDAKAEADRVTAEEAALLAFVSSEKKRKKKERREVFIQEEPMALLSPLLAPIDSDAALFYLVKDIPEDQILAELGKSLKTVSVPGTLNTLCPRRSYHLLEDESWTSCEGCYAM
jgi:hypothetical protein